jgi:hypothetical protein
MRIYICLLLFFAFVVQACDDDDTEPILETPLLLSYETVAGHVTFAANYEYDSDRRVTKISWQREVPGVTRGSDVFIYDEQGRLKQQERSITGLVDEVVNYTWDDDLVFASATYSNNRKIAFSFYDYNEADQLESVEFYKWEGPGFLRTDSIGFTYHPDGNLFKMNKYTFDHNALKLIFVSSQTFSEYLSSPNPVPTIEILPSINLQRSLPKDYTVSNTGNSQSYLMQYDLRADGFPKERIVTSIHGSEKTIYVYDK